MVIRVCSHGLSNDIWLREAKWFFSSFCSHFTQKIKQTLNRRWLWLPVSYLLHRLRNLTNLKLYYYDYCIFSILAYATLNLLISIGLACGPKKREKKKQRGENMEKHNWHSVEIKSVCKEILNEHISFGLLFEYLFLFDFYDPFFYQSAEFQAHRPTHAHTTHTYTHLFYRIRVQFWTRFFSCPAMPCLALFMLHGLRFSFGCVLMGWLLSTWIAIIWTGKSLCTDTIAY